MSTVVRQATIGDISSMAVFSQDMKHRFRLRRSFAQQPDMLGGDAVVRGRFKVKNQRLLYIMLNPSTADELKNDPTVERCQRRALMKGYGEFEVVNLFSLRATNPRELYKQDPSDEMIHVNLQCVMDAVKEADYTILGWGNHGKLFKAGESMWNMLIKSEGNQLTCLGVSKTGQPVHPLYIPYSREPIVFPGFPVTA